MIEYRKIIQALNANPIPLLIFLSSIFIFMSFAGTRLFLSDEGLILDQFYNLINGSLSIKIAKINTASGIFMLVGNNLYAAFSYSLLILTLPVYYILNSIDQLKSINQIYGAHLFLLQLWALIGGVLVYLLGKIRNQKQAALLGVISYVILIGMNLYYFVPIDFPKWGELLSIQFTNILLSSLLVLVVYYLFKGLFGNKIAIFASFFVIFATPVSFYAITLKHHILAVFLTVLAFYFFYRYYENKQDKFIYLAYASAGFCVWTRILDGAALLAALLIMDILFLRRNVKHIVLISIVVLVSLIPFFIFNYLILGSPFSVIETIPVTDKQVSLYQAKDFISLEETPEKTRQIELLNELGYIWSSSIRGDWVDILRYTTFLRLINTFGIFLVSPFLTAALAFSVYGIKRRIRLNMMDMLFLVYTVIFLAIYKNYIFALITDTPMGLEYRYLLIFYLILLYFAMRIEKLKGLIENNLKTIAIAYCGILVAMVVYFIVKFPLPFMDIFYKVSLATSLLLLILLSISILFSDMKSAVLDKSMIFVVALTLAEASFLLLFYYWVVSMTYIAPAQNHTILPVIGDILKLMYQNII